MGTDIHGWAEYWDPDVECWVGILKLAPLVSDRDYELFAWLFGVRRRPDIPVRWNDEPIAAGRGLPPDASREAADHYGADLAQFPHEFHGATWITWREMQAIDWDERIEDRIVEAHLDAQGQEQPGATRWWRTTFLQAHAALLPVPIEGLAPGLRWTVGHRAYEVVAMHRRDVLEASWEVLFRLMEVLASRCQKSDHLRLVVWFDG